MRILKRFFGYRWSLYIVLNGNELCYVIHENSVVNILGYIIRHFKEYGNPSPPWSLHLNFNHNHTSFQLQRQHFTEDGIDLSPLLLTKLSDIDPKHNMIRSSEPIILHAATKHSIPISNSRSVEEMINRLSNENRENEVTLISILDLVFGVTDTA